MNLITFIEPGILVAITAVCQDEVDKRVNFELAVAYLVQVCLVAANQQHKGKLEANVSGNIAGGLRSTRERLVLPSLTTNILSYRSSWMSRRRICLSGSNVTRKVKSCTGQRVTKKMKKSLLISLLLPQKPSRLWWILNLQLLLWLLLRWDPL